MTKADYRVIRSFLTQCGLLALHVHNSPGIVVKNREQTQTALDLIDGLSIAGDYLELKLLITSTRLFLDDAPSAQCREIFINVVRLANRWFETVKTPDGQLWWQEGAMA